MVDSKEGVQAKTKNPSQKSFLSLNRQLELLHVSKIAHYYEKAVPFSSKEDIKLLNTIDKIHTKYPFYGTRSIFIT